MNDIFSFKRFLWLFRKTLLERPVQLGGLIGLTLVSSLLVYVVLRYMIGFEEGQNASFVFGMIGGGSFLASFIFNYFSSNAYGSSYLTLPASTFEKWLCGVLITGVIFTGIFLGFFYIMDAALVMQYHNSLDPHDPYYRDMYEAVNRYPLTGFLAMKTYMMFLNFAGAMLVGSLYFNKAAFIKVALVVCGLIIGGEFLNYFVANMIFDPLDKAMAYYAVFIPVGKDFGKVELPAYASHAVDTWFMIILPAVLWIVAYVRLKEKEF